MAAKIEMRDIVLRYRKRLRAALAEHEVISEDKQQSMQVHLILLGDLIYKTEQEIDRIRHKEHDERIG